MRRILISACLMGRPVRYDGRAKTLGDAWLARWHAEGRLVVLCPEVAAGFATPRAPAEIANAASAADVLAGHGAIVTDTGTDVTAGFVHGAALALALARESGCRYALLTDGSPSCGSRSIHSGRFDGIRRPGRGVVAQALIDAGIAVYPEHEIAALAAALDRA